MDIREVRRHNLKKLMDKRFGIGARGAQSRLADLLGKPQNYLSRCLAEPDKSGSKTIGEDFAREIEKAFRLKSYALDSLHLGSDQSEDHANVTPMLQPARKAKEYPLISWIAAGERAESPDNYAVGDGETMLESTENAGPHGYWLKVKGKSMTADSPPSFPEGTPILVRPEGFDVISGKFYIAKHTDGETTFKQYVMDAGTAYLAPLNPTFKTVQMDDEWRLIGRVIDAKVIGL